MEGEGEYGIPRGIPTFSDGRKIEEEDKRDYSKRGNASSAFLSQQSKLNLANNKKDTLNFGTHLLHGAGHCIFKRLPKEDQAGKH